MRLDDLPDQILCLVAESLDHSVSLQNLALASRGTYIAMQLRYKSLCIQNGFISFEKEDNQE